MRMRPNWTMIIVGGLLAANAVFTIVQSGRAPRLAYVRSSELVYGYFGMKEAITEFQNKQAVWKANVDTLALDLKRTIDRAERERPSLSPLEIEERGGLIRKQRNDLANYEQAMITKMKEEERRMLEGVLAEVNGFVEQYADENGFDMVLGTTDDGSLLYGEGAMDITDEILMALNRNHSGE